MSSSDCRRSAMRSLASGSSSTISARIDIVGLYCSPISRGETGSPPAVLASSFTGREAGGSGGFDTVRAAAPQVRGGAASGRVLRVANDIWRLQAAGNGIPRIKHGKREVVHAHIL